MSQDPGGLRTRIREELRKLFGLPADRAQTVAEHHRRRRQRLERDARVFARQEALEQAERQEEQVAADEQFRIRLERARGLFPEP